MKSINPSLGFSRKGVSLGLVDATGNGVKNNLVTLDVDVEFVNKDALTVELKRINGYYKLSIVGNIWNASRTDVVSGGQCQDTIREFLPMKPGGRDKAISQLLDLWDQYHRNDMRAGTRQQMEVIKLFRDLIERHEDPADAALEMVENMGLVMDAIDEDTGLTNYELVKRRMWDIYNVSGYTRDKMILSKAGLLYVEGDGFAYEYGTAWLVEGIPAGKIARIRDLVGDVHVKTEEPDVMPKTASAKVVGNGVVTHPDHAFFGANRWKLLLSGYSFDYYTGQGIAGEPEVKDILASLFNDSAYLASSADEFCDELGYDLDEGEAIWDDIAENDRRLREALGTREYNRLAAIYLEY